MDLVTIDDVPQGSPGARLSDGTILHLRRAARTNTIETLLPSTNIALLGCGAEGLDIARRIVTRAEDGTAADELAAARALLPPDTPLLAPVIGPRLIVAQGLAYRSHLEEMSGTPEPAHPTAFLKSPSSIVGPEASVCIPSQASGMVDYEGEIAFVFGRTAYRVDESEALACIAGVTAANDISARDWTPGVFAATDPWEARLTWEVNIMGKQLPGFTPLGPALRTLDSIADLDALRVQTRLNGQVLQDDTLGGSIFPVEKAIAYFSQWYRFEPGDILLTGTPAGVGLGRNPPIFLQPGDRIEVEVEGAGTLSTPITGPA
ncbi:MAG: fumarylacetoacetate hydrolase family protein [Sphingomonadaceae bacterium]|nr:fumarylacetoacetate hydrolase family protein [Sphingomonadaceae bacterium]MCP5390853.1 fumarylacetoacetate hydrolase family protein [Sphingomonadaceae bacterium]MCP5394609.1 fumarylacetoacetate hydrolase family protein [Sphingomonadaceae bacterium]